MITSRSSILWTVGGIMLGLGVITAGASFYPYAAQASQPQRAYASVNTTSNQGGPVGGTIASNTTNPVRFGPASSVGEIASQPMALTGVVFLPVLAAFTLGFIMYKASKSHKDAESR